MPIPRSSLEYSLDLALGEVGGGRGGGGRVTGIGTARRLDLDLDWSKVCLRLNYQWFVACTSGRRPQVSHMFPSEGPWHYGLILNLPSILSVNYYCPLMLYVVYAVKSLVM